MAIDAGHTHTVRYTLNGMRSDDAFSLVLGVVDTDNWTVTRLPETGHHGMLFMVLLLNMGFISPIRQQGTHPSPLDWDVPDYGSSSVAALFMNMREISMDKRFLSGFLDLISSTIQRRLDQQRRLFKDQPRL